MDVLASAFVSAARLRVALVMPAAGLPAAGWPAFVLRLWAVGPPKFVRSGQGLDKIQRPLVRDAEFLSIDFAERIDAC